MAILSLLNNFELPLASGTTITAKQGEVADAIDTPFEYTVSGYVHHVTNTLATATVHTIYDDDSDVPADFDYGWFWCSVDMYLQIIGSGSNVIFKVEAFMPFIIPGFDTILAAADTTVITGGAEPSLTDIDSIAVGNYSGGAGVYELYLID